MTAKAKRRTAADTKLHALRSAAAQCRNCPLWKDATQTVFGIGPATARVMLVGEQPGDREDLAGEPFVGPAGGMLRKALDEIGLDPAEVYLTNAVKHFKFELRGKRRLHKTPAQRDIEACRGWLLQEIELVRPRLIVALGATAVKALLHRPLPILKNRGTVIESTLPMSAARDTPASTWPVLITVHPSSLLRMPDADRRAAYRAFVQDLRQAA